MTSLPNSCNQTYVSMHIIHIKVSKHHRVRTDELRMFKWMVPFFEVGPVPGGWDVVLLTGGPVPVCWEVVLVDGPVHGG